MKKTALYSAKTLIKHDVAEYRAIYSEVPKFIFASIRLLFPQRFALRLCGCAALPGRSLGDA